MTTRARREREKEERRQSILQAARETFFEEGFYRATVDSVAERAEVSKGTVYLYFDSKEALLAALLLEGLDTLLQTLETACPLDEPLSAEERLRRIGWAYLQFFHHEPQYFRLLVAMSRGRFRDTVTPELYQEVLEASMEGLSYVTRAVEQGVAEGTFTCCDTHQAAAILWATLNGVLELMDHPLRQEMVGVEPEVLYHAAMDIIIQGLRYNPAAPDEETTGRA